MPTVADLGKSVRAKYPGAYDDLSDDALGKAVKAKYPGAYDDFADLTPDTPAPSAAAESLGPPEAPKNPADVHQETLYRALGPAVLPTKGSIGASLLSKLTGGATDNYNAPGFYTGGLKVKTRTVNGREIPDLSMTPEEIGRVLPVVAMSSIGPSHPAADGWGQRLKDYLLGKSGEKFAKTTGGIQSDINKVRGGVERVAEAGRTGRDMGVLTPLGRPAGTLERVTGKAQEVGDALGKELPAVNAALEASGLGAETAVNPDLMAVATRIQSEITGPLRNIGTPDAVKLADFAEEYASGLLNNAAMHPTGAIPFDAAHDLRRVMDAHINWSDQAQAIPNRLRIQIRKMLDEEIGAKLDSAGKALGDPQAADRWAGLNKDFSDLKILQSFARKGAQRAAGNRTVGLTDTIMGATGLATGDPLKALEFMAGNKLARSYGSGLQGLAYEKAGQAAGSISAPGTSAAAPAVASVAGSGRLGMPVGLPSAAATEAQGQAAVDRREGGPSLAPSHSTPAMGTEAIIGRLSSRPNMGHYANLLRKAGTGAGALHFELYEKDPTYRAAVMAGEQK